MLHFKFIGYIILLEIVIFGARSNLALANSIVDANNLVPSANTVPCISDMYS